MNIAMFQALACVSFIFGRFVLLVILLGSLFSGLPQPDKGVLRSGTATLIALAAYALDRLPDTQLRGLTDLSPAHDHQTTVMLAITFQGIAVFSDSLGSLPFRQDQ